MQENFENLDRVIINDSKTSKFSKVSKKKSDQNLNHLDIYKDNQLDNMSNDK